MQKVICIMGPTGTGKSDTALNIAKNGYSIHVINADSRQVYTDFPIISAQPDNDEKSVCPHKLYGYLTCEQKICAGQWISLASQAIEEAHAKENIPVIVGGTGLYFKALFDGMVQIPPVSHEIHEKVINACTTQGSHSLHKILMEIDPPYAQKIHPNDKQRVARALEVFEQTGKTFTKWHEETPSYDSYNVLRIGIGLPLNELTPLLHERINRMLSKGALQEAVHALEKCPDLKTAGWSSIGCRELAAYIHGKINMEECIHLWQKNTRAYAKRQWTWFRADQRIQWFNPNENPLPAIEKFLRN